MKDKSAIFILIATLIIVWFVAKGLLSYWENQVQSYYKTTLGEICYDYNGDPEYRDFIGKSYDGTERPMTRFTCEFSNND